VPVVGQPYSRDGREFSVVARVQEITPELVVFELTSNCLGGYDLFFDIDGSSRHSLRLRDREFAMLLTAFDANLPVHLDFFQYQDTTRGETSYKLAAYGFRLKRFWREAEPRGKDHER